MVKSGWPSKMNYTKATGAIKTTAKKSKAKKKGT